MSRAIMWAVGFHVVLAIVLIFGFDVLDMKKPEAGSQKPVKAVVLQDSRSQQAREEAIRRAQEEARKLEQQQQ